MMVFFIKLSYYLALLLIVFSATSRTQNNPEIRIPLNEHYYSAHPASCSSLVSITAPDETIDLEGIPPLLGSGITANLGSVDINSLAEEYSFSADDVPPLLGSDTTTPSMSTSLSAYPITQPQAVKNTPIAPNPHTRERTLVTDESSFFLQLLTHLQTHASAQKTSEYVPHALPQSPIQSTTPSSSSAQSHLEFQQTHNTNPRIPCPICKNTFANKHILKNHMKLHTSIKPYKCTYKGCTKVFARKDNRNRHMRIHTGEKPFKCTTCNKLFAHQGAMKRHMRTHTGEKPFKCLHDRCNKAFSRKSYLERHMREHTDTIKSPQG